MKILVRKVFLNFQLMFFVIVITAMTYFLSKYVFSDYIRSWLNLKQVRFIVVFFIYLNFICLIDFIWKIVSRKSQAPGIKDVLVIFILSFVFTAYQWFMNESV